MLTIIIGAVLWVVCGVVAYGYSVAFQNGLWWLTATKNIDYSMAPLMVVLGPIGLVASACAYYGLTDKAKRSGWTTRYMTQTEAKAKLAERYGI